MHFSNMTVLNQQEMDEIHAGALRILEETGFGTNCTEILELAESAGLEEQDGVIHVKAAAVDRAFETVPRSFRLYNPSGKAFKEVGGGESLFSVGIRRYLYRSMVLKRPGPAAGRTLSGSRGWPTHCMTSTA